VKPKTTQAKAKPAPPVDKRDAARQAKPPVATSTPDAGPAAPTPSGRGAEPATSTRSAPLPRGTAKPGLQVPAVAAVASESRQPLFLAALALLIVVAASANLVLMATRAGPRRRQA
jgi:hypothetical protein